MRVGMFVTATAVLLAGCEKSADSFSLLSEQQSFKQTVDYVQRPVDILWVVDNSGSMETSQTNLASNFQSFISRFSQLNYDFHMGVIPTDSYLAYHYDDNNRSRLRDGISPNQSGVRIMDKNTPNLSQVFLKNVTLGTNGNGDERAFSSIEHAVGNPLNNGFRRAGAFLSIIIVSDEDDFSHTDWQNGTNSYFFSEDYNHASMHPVSRMVNLLNTATSSVSGGIRNYSVSTISILDSACAANLTNEFAGRKIGQRYIQLADATGGTKSSLCGDFGTALQNISDRVIELSSVFKLDREPYLETIVIRVNGSAIPQSSTNGWSYNSTTQSIHFNGSAVPPAGADVKISFDPKSVKL